MMHRKFTLVVPELTGAETWMGRHPALTAATVLNIARQAEMVFNYSGHYQASAM